MNFPILARARLIACVLASTFGPLVAHAEITLFLPPAADTTLRENQPDNNFGASQVLAAGVSGTGTPRNRALFRFDLSPLPADAVLNSVKLRFTVAQAGPTSPPATFEVRRVLKSWNQGSKSGLAATIGEATWTARAHEQLTWDAGGGLVGTDFAASASATTILNSAGSVSEFNSPQLLADVYLWKTNAATNFGWVLMASGEPAGSGKQVGSRENLTNAPVLELRFSSYSIYNILRLNNALRFSFDATSNQTYAVEYRDSDFTGAWTTLTNIPAFPAATTIHVTNQPTVTPRYYRLRRP